MGYQSSIDIRLDELMETLGYDRVKNIKEEIQAYNHGLMPWETLSFDAKRVMSEAR